MIIDNSQTEVVRLTEQLIKCPSVTPNDAGCQDIIASELAKLGFEIKSLKFNDTSNLWATRGNAAPHFVFAGHTDVVPPGEISAWTADPFQPLIRDNKLYGRGAVDMKGAIAAMLVAVKQLLTTNPDCPGTLSFLITSDEEGPADDGTQRVLEYLQQQKVHIDYCIVGEPVSQQQLADTVKLGSRGSMSCEIKFTGQQGHVGHADRAINPIHATLAALDQISKIIWDHGNEDFPATSLQFTYVDSDSGAGNVIPANLTCRFNIRFNPLQTVDGMQAKILDILNTQQKLPYSIHWRVNGEPYLSKRGALTTIVAKIIKKQNNQAPTVRAVGGTSDARFIVPSMGCETIELGLMDTTMHEIDEHVPCSDLQNLTVLYQNILEQLFVQVKQRQDETTLSHK